MDIIAWLGSILLAFCGLPLCLQSIFQGHMRGVNLLFLVSWWLGEILLFMYILVDISSPQLLTNYAINIIFTSTMLWYKLFPRDGL